MSSFTKLLIVIPTRNRADYAINAINSVLRQDDCEYEIIVSDNSTSPKEVTKLKDYCEKLQSSNLSYIRPKKPLSMTKHWNWAISQAMQNANFSHLGYLTDRMVFKPYAFQKLRLICSKYSDQIVTYFTDGVSDFGKEITVTPVPFSGKIFDVKADFIIHQAAKCRFIPSIPRMLNCIVPVSVLKKIKLNQANIFESIAPDYYFAYNSLSIVSSIIFLDNPILSSYGENISNGNNTMRGIMSKTAVDFFENLDYPISIESPVPYLLTPTDAILNEYVFVKNKSESEKFREIDKAKYEKLIATDVVNFKSSKIKRECLIALYKHLGIRMLKYHLKGLFPLKTYLSKPNLNSKKISVSTSDEGLDFLANAKPKLGGSLDYLNDRIGGFPGKTIGIKELSE